MQTQGAFTKFFSVALVALCAALPAYADQTVALSDAAPPHSPAFEEMLAHVYQENPQLAAERDALRVLDEHISEAVAGFRPSLAVTTEIGAARVSQAGEDWRYGQDRNLALVATQPLYNGATIGQWHAAKKRVLEGRARLLAAEQKVLLTAITAWMDMCEKEKLVVLNRDNNRLAQSYLDATRQRLAAGDGTQTDVAIAQSRASDSDTRYAMAQAARDAARATYQRATGLPPQESELPAVPANLPYDEKETLELVKNSPELQEADYEVAASEDDIDSASGGRWPSIYLRGMMSDEHAEDLGLSNIREDSITINASIPIYQGGVEYARVREAKIANEKSRFDAMMTSRDINENARQAWSRFRTALAVINAAEHGAEAANMALADISEEQNHGTRTLTEVLDAQAQALNAKITALEAQTDLRLSAYRLLAATGRLTARSLNLPTRIYDETAHYDDVATRWFGTSVDPNPRP